MNKVKLLDCTMRDGGYYNNWDFEVELINRYLKSMSDVSVDYVELGLRSFKDDGYKGACAYTTDNFLESLSIPNDLKIGVMVNADELLSHKKGVIEALKSLFVKKENSKVDLVRIACHAHEFEETLIGAEWLKSQGYIVGYNLMQIASRTQSEIIDLAKKASKFPLDVLYFADSLGSLNPQKVITIIKALRKGWSGELGIHAHDNLNSALLNSLQAIDQGVTWIDGTVTGMGRGPGNTKTEYLVLAVESKRNVEYNITSLTALIDDYFKKEQLKYGWGTNTYYYLAGTYGIHPTYIQQMLGDSRFSNEDILSVIDFLKAQSSHKFDKSMLEVAQRFYEGKAQGKWKPSQEIDGKEVLILGTGPGVEKYKEAIETYIKLKRPYVIALNTQNIISEELIDVRAACHPSRLMADIKVHLTLPQPLITPYSMLNKTIQKKLESKEIKDFGISSDSKEFLFYDTHCNVPKVLVLAYALAIANSGRAQTIMLAGFDGYFGDDPRNMEINNLFDMYYSNESAIKMKAITPTKYNVEKGSIFKMIGDVQQ